MPAEGFVGFFYTLGGYKKQPVTSQRADKLTETASTETKKNPAQTDDKVMCSGSAGCHVEKHRLEKRYLDFFLPPQLSPALSQVDGSGSPPAAPETPSNVAASLVRWANERRAGQSLNAECVFALAGVTFL